MATVFFSYSHVDEDLRDQLETQLAALKRQGVIETWHDRRISAGEELSNVIDQHINSADIVLLLVSPDFIASDYCYEIETKRAMERHRAGEATVIPVILRPCEWKGTPFGQLLASPRDGKPVTQWPDRDEAFLQVAQAIRKAAERLDQHAVTAHRTSSSLTPARSTGPNNVEERRPRSSNLRLSRTFTQKDKDNFRVETFDYIARYFENSLSELQARNSGIEGNLRRVDANRFFVNLYRNGNDAARATIYMDGDIFRDGINYVNGERTDSSSYNEALSIGADDQSLYLKSSGMASYRDGHDRKLSQEGAAELFWEMFIEPLQQSRRR